MNINQYQSCLTSLNEIQTLDCDKIIFDAYPEIVDMTQIVFSKYNAEDFMVLFNRMIRQLQHELTDGLKLLLPNTENYQNDFGSVDLSSELPLFKRYFESKNFTHLEPLLDKFIHYQIKNGFWNKTVIKTTVIEQNKLKAQFELIDKNQKALTNNIEAFENLKQNFSQKIAEIDSIILTKKAELDQITQNLNSSTNQSNEITVLLASVTNKDTEASGIIHNLTGKVEAIDVDIKNYQESYGIIENQWETLEKDLQKNLKDATSNFEKSKEHIEFTESRREQIEKLTGMAADGALGTKFHQREETIEKGRKLWIWIVPIMTIVSIFWIIAVFNWYPAKFKNEWVNLSVNLLKTAPAFILLGFVFKQYTKERNLEEEYAFKSAVAMTLTAYSNMLSERDIERNDSRQKMLLESIEKLYNQPKIYPEKSSTVFSFSTKHLKDSVDSLNESVKNVKGE